MVCVTLDCLWCLGYVVKFKNVLGNFAALFLTCILKVLLDYIHVFTDFSPIT